MLTAGQRFLGAQRPDLADRADQRRLARAEPARNEDLEYGERAAGAVPSEGAEPMQYLLEQVGAGLLAGGLLAQHRDPALRR